MKVSELRILVGKSYILKVRHWRIIKEFQESTWESHYAHGRSKTEIIKNISAKSAELAVYEICHQYNIKASPPDFSNQPGGDGGVDMIIENYPMDIKEIDITDGRKKQMPISMYDQKQKFYLAVSYDSQSGLHKILGIIPWDINWKTGYSYVGNSYRYCPLSEIPKIQEHLHKYDEYF